MSILGHGGIGVEVEGVGWDREVGVLGIPLVASLVWNLRTTVLID